MITLMASNSKHGRAYVPTTALAKSVDFKDEMTHVLLTDSRIISVPLIWFPTLRHASPEQRARYEIGAATK